MKDLSSLCYVHPCATKLPFITKSMNFTPHLIMMVIIIFVVVLLILLFRLWWFNRKQHRLMAAQNRHLESKNQELARLHRELEQAHTTLETSHNELTTAHASLESSYQELNRLNLQLQEATRSKERFYINVSHDLRSPLTLIAEPISELMHSEGLDDRQKLLLNLANKNVHILMRMMGQILDFGKLENNELTLTLREVDVRAAFNEWGNLFRAAAVSRHIALAFDVVSAESYVMAIDVEKVEHLFFNLMSNALKFTPAGGHIWVRLQQEEIRGRQCLQIIVSDDGPGMTPDEQAHIFDRFYQSDRQSPSGSGIGLVLVKAFVELHGGRIAVRSEAGHGATFTVTLPIQHTDDRQRADVQPAYNRSEVSDATFADELAKVEMPEDVDLDEDADTVLIIDDNADMRVLLRTLLSPHYTVLQASGGAQGFKMAMKYLPRLIVCDVVMPGIDGMEVCRRIKAEPLTAHIPVLLLTACALDEQRIEGYACGADAYISKPFDHRVLVSRCDALIANRRALFATAPDGLPEAAAAVANAEGTDKNDAAVREAAAQPMDVESDFYRDFLKVVNEEIGNPDLSVVDLASKMGLSRVQFYRKIKALTNYSPAELLRIIRLKRAATLLKTTERTVAEISYAVGFSSPSYFARCYRDYFGESPTNVQERTSKSK